MDDALSHLKFFFILHALSVFLAMHTHSPKKWMHESKKKTLQEMPHNKVCAPFN
jgi:hypothetical protein